MVNVYGKQNFGEKRKMSGDLFMSRRCFPYDLWCVLEYFNYVCYSAERKVINEDETLRDEVEARRFRGFIRDIALSSLGL